MAKKIGFRQDKKTNIAVSDGCDHRCKIEARPVIKQCEENYKLFIGGEPVCKYINEYDEEVFIVPGYDRYKCIDLGFKIAKLCDCYKTNMGAKSVQQQAPLQIAQNDTEKEILTDYKMRELFCENYKFIKYFNFDDWRYDDGARIHSTSFDSEVMTELKQKLKQDKLFGAKYELVAVVGMTVDGYSVCGLGECVLSPIYQAPNKKYMGLTGMVGTFIVRDKQTGKILPVPNEWYCAGRALCYQLGYMSVQPELEFVKALVRDKEMYEKMIGKYAVVKSK